MSLKNIETVGELQDYEFIIGVIQSLHYADDTCDVLVDGQVYSAAPLLYHCNASAPERSNGAIQGAVWGFAVGDGVVCMRQRVDVGAEIFVIGHKSGARPCRPVIAVVMTQVEGEAVAWDLINDCVVVEINTKAAVLAALTSYGVTEQTECGVDDERTYCWISSPTLVARKLHADLPVWNMTISEYPPFYEPQNTIVGMLRSQELYNCIDDGEDCADNKLKMVHAFFTNPDTSRSQIPRPGQWLADIYGAIPYEDWDAEECGPIPYDWGQNWQYYVSPPRTERNFSPDEEYLFFRSIFDYFYSGGSASYPPLTQLSVAGLTLGATLMYKRTRDAEYFHPDEIVDATWLASGQIQSQLDFLRAYQVIGNTPGTANNPSESNPTYNLLLPHVVMFDQGCGMATNDEISLLFEYASVYPNLYEFHEKEKVWDAEGVMLAKLKQEFRIYYRTPYFKSNVDAILFNRVNDERVGLGLLPLKLNYNLYKAAEVFAKDMAGRESIEPPHIGSDGSLHWQRALAQNYAKYINTHSAMGYGLSENIQGNPIGLNVQVERVVDNTDTKTPTDYTVTKTGEVKTIVGDGWQHSHTKDGLVVELSGDGWKQSPGHWSEIIYANWTEAGLFSQFDADSYRSYISQSFGMVGNPSNWLDQTKQKWPGFTTFNTEKLLTYINENFTFTAEGDQRRKPKVWLCTIPV